MTPADLSIEDIRIGDSASFTRTFSEEEVTLFSKLSGDENPLHMEDAYAETTRFKRRLVHGMLVASACSALVGMRLPGKRCLYLAQTLSFKKPVYIGDTLTVRGVVTTKSASTGVVTIAISIKKGEDEVMSGLATVQII